MSAFEKIKQGLNEAIAYERGEIKASVSYGYIAPLPSFSAQEIKDIREKTKLTQWLFAKYMGVSVKTVEAWESGRNAPNGTACRMLALTKDNPNFPTEANIVNIAERRDNYKKSPRKEAK